MKKILRILVFILGGIFIFSQKVSADCLDYYGYKECTELCVGVNNQVCMQSCDNQFPGCFGAPAPIPELPELKCEDKCDEYAAGEAREACICKCNGGVVLNTDIPFIGRCIPKDSGLTTTDLIAQAITKILMTIILVWGFGNLIFAGVQFASNNPTGGKKRIIDTIIAFAVIGSIGLILRLINPNIFK